MNKYYIQGKVVQAKTPKAAFEKAGLEVPQHVIIDTGFAVKHFIWDPEVDDYAIEDLSPTGMKPFKEFVDVLECYENTQGDTLLELSYNEARVDLTQYKFGFPRVMQSKIVFAPKVSA